MEKKKGIQNMNDVTENVGVNELSDDAVEAITGGYIWEYNGRWYCGKKDGTLYNGSAKKGYGSKKKAKAAAFFIGGDSIIPSLKVIDCPVNFQPKQ